MRRALAGLVAVGALALTGCSASGGPSIGVGSPTTTLAHTAADVLACGDLDVLYSESQKGEAPTAEQGSVMEGAALAASNAQLRSEAQQLETDSQSGNQQAVSRDIGVMGGICDAMGEGPPS